MQLLQQIIDGDPAEQSLLQLRHNLHAAVVEPRGGQHQRHRANQRLRLMRRQQAQAGRRLQAHRRASSQVRRNEGPGLLNERLDGGGAGRRILGERGEAGLHLLPQLFHEQEAARHGVLQEGEGQHAGPRAPRVLFLM